LSPEAEANSPSGGPSGGEPDCTAWYPGKNLKKLPRPFLALKRRIVQKRDLRQTSIGGTRAATLRVSLLRGRGLPASRPYVELSLEGFECRSQCSKGGDVDLFFEESSFVFNVQDVTASLSILIFDDYSIHHERCVGRVLVPVTTCLRGMVAAPPSRAWFRVFPPGLSDTDAAANERFENGVMGVPGSAMARPRQPLGYLELELDLQLAMPLPVAYVTTEPWFGRFAGAPEARLDENGVPVLEPRLLRSNIARLKRVAADLAHPPLLEPLPRLVVLFPTAVRLCLFSRGLWEVPLWGFFLITVNALLHQLAPGTAPPATAQAEEDGFAAAVEPACDGLLVWEDQLGPNTMVRGALAKIKMLKETVAKLQFAIGKLAVTLERMLHLWKGTDPMLTLLATTALAGASIVASIVLFLVPLRILIFSGACAFIFKPFLPRRQDPGSAAGAASNADDGGGAASEEKQGDPQPASKQPKQSRLQNALGRIPDASEVAHRRIAAMQGPISESQVRVELRSSSKAKVN